METFLPKLYVILFIFCISSIEGSLLSRHEKLPTVTPDNKELKNGKLTWICPFKGSVKNLSESEDWHNFLNALYCKFSEYKIQVVRRNYTLNNTTQLEEYNCEIEKFIDEVQKRQIEENNFEKFLNETIRCNLTEYDSVESNVVTRLKVDELNHVLNLTLRDRLHVECEETNVFIKGNYITASDITDILFLKREVINSECKSVLSNDKAKFLNIFALNTFFIDVNINSSIINSHKIVLMSVIAPKWENIGKNKIDLKGESGELFDGIDGTPGKPGSPGGNFFGIGSKYVNGLNFEISVNGGNGSQGKEGRKGKTGGDGTTPSLPPNLYCTYTLCNENEYFKNFNCKLVKCEFDYNKRTPSRWYNVTRWCRYELFGKIGAEGGNGGNGGKGGKAGYPGNISLIELKNPSQIYVSKNTGHDGVDGKGGAGGLGGKKGSDITVKCDSGFWKSSWSVESTKPNNERGKTGPNGADGGNSNGKDNPDSPLVIKNLDKAKIINQYKSYLRYNMHDRFTNFFLNEFLNQIENNINVKKVYNTLGLIDELQHLEEQFHTLNKKINLIPFYQSLLQRISEYAQVPQETGDPRQYKKVLCYLYTATLSKIHNIEGNVESNLIIDIYSYLSSIKNDINKLTDLKNAKYKEKLINKYKDEYKHEIDVKINDAKELISKDITPDIHKIGTQIDSQMETLVNEVIHLQEQTEKEHSELIEKQQQLESTLGLQGVLSVFKIFGAVVSFLGPVGAVAGSVIETGSTIAESFISDNEGRENKILELPQSVSELNSINSQIKIIIYQKITCLNNSLEGISLEIIKHPDILSSMSFKILSIKDRLDKLDKNKLNLTEIQALETELDAVLQTQEEKSDHKNAKHLAVIKNLKRIVQISTLLYDSYDKFKNNRAKLDAISSAIEQNEENLRKLKEYQQKIYDSIIPMLQNVQNDLQDVISKLGTKSKVALDVTKWHVQSTLRDMLLLMHQFTRGFKMENNLARCIEKLEETMDALINVHEHIQDYQKDQNLANYIAEISSIAITDIVIGNNAVLQNETRDAVLNLEIKVRSNIVLQRYKIAMKAFKQFVFPFAHNYFEDLILPSHLTLNDAKDIITLENLVTKAAIEIDKINSKLEDYKNTVTNRDGCIGIGQFKSDYVSSQPFFVWKNEQYNNMISKLLSGSTIMVKADVRHSTADKDAVKFNVVEFNFKSKNETLQSEINNKLKRFQITVNHLGNSYYRYENKFYEMMTGSQEIWYYFEKKANGEPVDYSLSYKKIMQGNVTLSPYASWKIKLDNVTNDISFKDLEIYKDSVDLTLEGYGYYLNKRSRNCIDLMVDHYYKAIDTNYYADQYVPIESFATDNLYPLQDNVFKRFKIFKGFF